MSSVGNDLQQQQQQQQQQLQQYLLEGILDGDAYLVKAALEVGANAKGSPGAPYAPIVAAAIANVADVIECLLEQGADPDTPVTGEISCPSSDGSIPLMPGERALHIAAENGSVEIVRLLLKGSRADPNVMDNSGSTPLLVTCKNEHVRVEVVRLLLEAGADPTLADNEGSAPLHVVAFHNHMDLVDMLYSRAPSALNSCTTNNDTPLSTACSIGHESMVSKLLSLGAIQPPDRRDNMCPLAAAAVSGCVGVVKVLINEGGIRAVGGRMALPKAIYMAIRFRHVEILRLLLVAVDGEKRRSEWANTIFRGKRLLHFAAGYYYPAAVSVLLEAGADEAARDSGGRIPRDVFEVDIGLDGEVQVDRGNEVAIRRMLHRGPAYRARSWGWPSDENADAGGSVDGDAAAAAAAVPLSLSPPAWKSLRVVDVRTFRPREKSSSKFFMRVVGRYSAKD